MRDIDLAGVALTKLMAVFIRALRLNRRYEPKPRYHHYAGAVGGELFVFAGRTTDFDKTKEELLSTIEVFDQYLEQWRQLRTTGRPPNGLYAGGYCVSPSGDLYVYGGYDGSTIHGGLYKLSSLEWNQLSGESDVPGPMKKGGCGMACFNKNKVAVIGGYGPPPASLQPGVTFIKDKDKRFVAYGDGQTDEIHVFDTDKCAWSSPTISGTRPPPMALFTLTSIDEYRALMFGGREGKHLQRVSDLYFIDFHTMVITKVERQGEEPWPVGRSVHAACCLGFGSKHPHLLVTGGIDNGDKTLGDVWLFDMTNRQWKELALPDDVMLRMRASVTAISLTPGLIEVTIFGGVPHYHPNQRRIDIQSIAATTILTFKYSESTWQLVAVAKSDQLGTSERLQKKIEKIKQFAREAPVSSDDRAEVQGLMDASSVSQNLMRERELHQQLEEANRRVERERERAEEAVREKDSLSQQFQQQQQLSQQLQQEQQQSQERIEQLQQEQQQSRERMEYSEVRAREAEAQLHEVQSHWIIPKSEIELTKEKLGKGAWGKVKVAKFRGTRVAAKCYHQILLSEHNLQLFRREISMAARLRHPNLVQFIGASIEGELILVTELMSTSLGALMHRGALSEANITSISLDVARALNYLHLMQPHPIIHRDICSGNVLLDPLPEDCWKAKVSDYGSVNLLQHLTTAHPGNPFYAAPESKDPDLQTPKMDIYSFGVLLAEMLTNELPEKKDRHRQILKISVERPNFVELVRQCLSEEGDYRPSAQEIITQLST